MRSAREAAFALCVGFTLLVMSMAAAAQQAPTTPAQPATTLPPRPPTPPLGDGPWDFETKAGRIHVTVVTKNLDHPWGMAFLPNGDMLVTERAGRMRVVRGGVLDPAPVSGMPAVRAVIIGGLGDVVLHPRYAQNRLIYFAYSKPDAQDPALSSLAVARARFDGGAALSDVEDVFVAADWYSSAIAGRNNRCCGQGPADASFGARLVRP